MLHGVTPGPTLLAQKPDMFWGIITSMFAGNLMLLVLNLPLIGVFAKLARLPTAWLVPVIALACVVGAYGVNNNAFDILVMLGFGVFGFYAERFGFSLAPLVLAFVLGPLMETSLRQSLIISDGAFAVFATRPISGGLLALTVLMVVLPLARRPAFGVEAPHLLAGLQDVLLHVRARRGKVLAAHVAQNAPVLGGGLAQALHAAAAAHVALHAQVQALHQRDRGFRFGRLVQRAVKLPVLEDPVVIVGLEAVRLVAQLA
jgi:hypothetical protein